MATGSERRDSGSLSCPRIRRHTERDSDSSPSRESCRESLREGERERKRESEKDGVRKSSTIIIETLGMQESRIR